MRSINNRNNISVENLIEFYGAAAGVFTTPCLLNSRNLEAKITLQQKAFNKEKTVIISEMQVLNTADKMKTCKLTL